MVVATAATGGLSDFGDPSFRTGLAILVKAYAEEAALNPLGEQMVYGGIIRLLSNRLRYVRDIHLHPEILQERIVKPIVILGLPRTGTSKLHRAMSSDPGVQRLDLWKQMNPAPFPGEIPGHPSARIEAALGVEQLLTNLFPAFMARHPLEAREPDEELHLMEGSFDCMLSWVFSRVPSFRDHVDACDPRPMYRWLHAMLQYLQWQDGGGRGRPWIMKSPVHIGALPLLLDTFPDATIVHCHRDPRKIIPSFASLITEARRISSDVVDPVEVGRDMLDYWALQLDRYLPARADLPANRILDVQFDEIRENVLGVIRRVCGEAGHPFTAEAMAACKAYDERRPEHHFGTYEYRPEDHGLDLEEIDRRFASYRRQFIVSKAA